MAKKESKKLDELFHDTLKDIYFAEKKILTVLPKWRRRRIGRNLRGPLPSTERRPRATSTGSKGFSRLLIKSPKVRPAMQLSASRTRVPT